MADIVLNVTIPDAKVSVAIAAIKILYPETVDMDAGEIKTFVENKLFVMLRNKLVRAKKRDLVDAIPQPDIL